MAQLKDLLVMGPGRVIGDAFFGGKLMPTITSTQDIGSSTVKWNNIYGTLKGNADTASYPEGFDNIVSNDTWGNDIGTAVTEWQMTNGGKIGFKNNNPQTGLLSLFINGRLYTSGSYPVPGLESSNSIWGLTDPDGATSNVAIRTPANGLYPYAPSNSTTAYSSLGAEGWYFNTAYIKTIYGYLSGTTAKAEAPSATITNYGVAYYDNNGKFASTLQGSGDQALVGSSTGPSWADIATTLTITGAANSNTDKFQISVLGHTSGDAVGLTKATTSLYGVTKLSSALYSSGTTKTTAQDVAATPKMVWDAIGTLDVNTSTSASSRTLTFVSGVTETDGKIAVTTALVQIADDDTAGIVDNGAQSFKGNKTFKGETTFSNNTTTTGQAIFNGNVTMNSAASADSLTAGSLLVTGNTSLANTTTTTTLLPSLNNSYNIGSSSFKYNTIYATTFSGTASLAKGASIDGVTLTQNSLIYIADSEGTFAKLSSDNGALYATSTNGELQFGTLPTAQGGTNNNSWTKYNIVYVNSSANALTGLACGDENKILASGGTNGAPKWIAQSSIAAGSATKVGYSSPAKYEMLYISNTDGTLAGTGAPTAGGYVVVSGGTAAPSWTEIAPALSQSADSNGKLVLNISVLGKSMTNGLTLTAASTSGYGVTKLTSSATTTSNNTTNRTTSDSLAATPNFVWGAIDTLDYTGASTNGSALEFITGVTQTDGKISATKAAVQSANGDTAGVVDANEQTFKGHKTFSDNITITGLATFNGNVLLNSATTADSLTAGSLLVTGNTSLVNTATTTTILPAANNSYNIGASGNKYATIYATTFDGAAEYAKKAYLAGASTGAQYGVLYLTASDKTIGATGQGNANTLLRAQGSDGAPYFDSISSALSINTANKDNGQTISVTFMGINGTSNVTLAKATATEIVSGTTTDGVYGVTKLSHSIDNTKTVAATPYGVKTYVDGEINDLTADMPSSNGTATNQIVFVSSVTESSGVISVQTQTVRSATTSQSGIVTTGTQSFAGSKTFTNAITVTGEANFNGNVHLNSSTIADSFQAGSLVVSGASSLTGTITTSNIIPANNNAYNIGTESNKYATIYATTFSGNASTATKLSNTPASNGTKVFLRGDNTWTNKLENTFESSGTPGFYANVAAGSWAYLRLQSGSTLFWDVAMKSNDNDGALEFRPAGTANKGPYIHYTGNMRIANAGTTDASNTTSALTLRETGYAGAGTDNWTTAPRLAFNWSGRKYAQIGLASNGYLYTAPNSQQANWYKIMYESGTWTININGDSTSCSGNAASASTVFASLSTSEKTYLLGTTSSLTSNGDNVELTGDSGVYLTENTGEISAVRHSWNYSGTEKAYTIWNNSTNSIDIMFL